MYISRVQTVLSLSQLEDDESSKRRLGPKAPVSQCAYKKLLKISVKKKTGTVGPPHVRSFGELSEIENFGIEDDSDTSSAAAEEEEECTSPMQSAVDAANGSKIESVMLGLWEMRAREGLFRYDVTACSTKTVPGPYGFLAQLNEGRASKKRPTEFRVDRVVQDFDESKFNFTKAYMQEVLFQFDAAAAAGASDDTEIDGDACAGRSPDIVMINVSPIEYGHVLLVPRVLDRLAQLITFETMMLALQFTAAVDSPYFRLGYNSLGAYATINHLHFQGYYLMAPFPVERAPTAPVVVGSKLRTDRVRVSVIEGYPVKGWVFEMRDAFDESLRPMAEAVAKTCMHLQETNVPHNMLICDRGARVFLWPQCYAEKQAMGIVPEDLLATGVNPAAFEIAGHVILKNRQDYVDVRQATVWRLLSQVSLDDDRFSDLTEACFAERKGKTDPNTEE